MTLPDIQDRARMASFLIKLAIRKMKAAHRPVEPQVAMSALASLRGDKAVSFFEQFDVSSAAKTTAGARLLSSKDKATLQKVTAAQTFVPGQGHGVRVNSAIGPFIVRDTPQGPIILNRDVVSFRGIVGHSSTFDVDDCLKPKDLYEQVKEILGGVNTKLEARVKAAESVANKPFRIERDYEIRTVGDKARRVMIFKIVRNDPNGKHDGETAYWIDPKIQSRAIRQQEEAQRAKELGKDDVVVDNQSPEQPAIFTSADKAAEVLNELTDAHNTTSIRTVHRFMERRVFLLLSTTFTARSHADAFTVFSEAIRDKTDPVGELNQQVPKIKNRLQQFQEFSNTPEPVAVDPAHEERLKQLSTPKDEAV
mgnify:CR=1 FL=1